MNEDEKILIAPKKAPTLYFIILGKLFEGLTLLLGAVSVYLLAKKNRAS